MATTSAQAGSPHGSALAAVRGWQQTRLWARTEELSEQDPEADAVATALKSMLPDIQAVLVSGATSPKDFTLHDAGHSVRVAENMTQIIPPDIYTALSVYELALLLLSAYSHDIGMTPNYGKTSGVLEYLATGSSNQLSGTEITKLMEWLDNEPGGHSVPLYKQALPTSDQIAQAQLLTAYYIRERHNEWSSDWIRQNLAHRSLGTYEGWLPDLIALNESHHEGYSILIANHFDARGAGSPSKTVNLRYLAVALRLADILEFDPERTPEVIFQHRLVDQRSEIYWAKDRNIAPKIEHTRVYLSCRPASACLHKAIEETIDAIDTELALCSRLQQERRFRIGVRHDTIDYRWDLPSVVDRDIQPQANTYEYIDGAFRPNTKKLLELLSSNALYGGDPFIAIRELLQNAFDAVKEGIASERLRATVQDASPRNSLIGVDYCVSLRLEQREENGEKRWWLCCTDNGVGMNKQVIEKYLLVSGSSRRHNILDLERRCHRAGFQLGRTGQFGIGVLAYFMLGDRIIIETRRSQTYDDDDGHGWRFETDGIGTFGELRSLERAQTGTTLCLRIRRELLATDPAEFVAKLRGSLVSWLAHIPCRFEFECPRVADSSITWDAGWVSNHDNLALLFMSDLEPRTYSRTLKIPGDLKANEELVREKEIETHYAEVRNEATKSLGWFQLDEGELPGGIGRYRITIPYFGIPGGACAAYLRLSPSRPYDTLSKIGQGYAFVPEDVQRTSWRGTIIDARGGKISRGVRGTCLEIDFLSSEVGAITVDRRGIKLTTQGLEAVHWARVRASRIRAERFAQAGGSHQALNAALCPPLVTSRAPIWRLAGGRKRNLVQYGRIRFPAITSCVFKYQQLSCRRAYLGSQRLFVLPCIQGHNQQAHYEGISWYDTGVLPTRIGLLRSYMLRALAIWDESSTAVPRKPRLAQTCAFPPAWGHLEFVVTHDVIRVWNIDGVFAKLMDEQSGEGIDAGTRVEDVVITKEFLELQLTSRARAASLIRWIIVKEVWELWSGIAERYPAFVDRLWELVFGGRSEQSKGHNCVYCFDSNTSFKDVVYELNPREFKRHTGKGARKLIPDPGAEWTITLEPTPEEIERTRELKELLAKVEKAKGRLGKAAASTSPRSGTTRKKKK